MKHIPPNMTPNQMTFIGALFGFWVYCVLCFVSKYFYRNNNWTDNSFGGR